MIKRLVELLVFILALPELLFEFICNKTGRLLILAITFGRARVKEESEVDAKAFNMWRRDANGIVISQGTAGFIGILFWLSMLILSIFAWDAFVRNPR